MMNKKKSITKIAALLLICCAFALFAASCSSSELDEAPDGMQALSKTSDSFKFFVPAGWTSSNFDGTPYAYYSLADKTNVSMSCTLPEDGVTTINEYLEKCREELAVLPEFCEIGEPRETTLGGKQAMEITYTANDGKNTYKYMMRVTVNGSHFYVFTYTSSPENFDSHAEDLELILSNISFK